MTWIYMIVLGGVLFTIAALLPGTKKKEQVENEMQAVMDSLDHFVTEMEEDNSELLEMVKQIKREQDEQIRDQELMIREQGHQLNKLYDRIDFVERQNHELSQKLLDMSMQTYPVIEMPSSNGTSPRGRRKKVVMEDTLPEPVQFEAQVVLQTEPQLQKQDSFQGRFEDVFALYSSGKSIEQISRKLGMNKGEVQLIIQLSQQEGGSR